MTRTAATPPIKAVQATVRPTGDDGMTLIELLVAMFVASILLAGVATVFIGTLRGVSTTNSKTSSGADVRIAMESMSRSVKVITAPAGQPGAFVSASTTGMSFYTLLNRTAADSTAEPVSTLVTYAWDPAGKCLNETKTPGVKRISPPSAGPYFTWTVLASQTKCLLRTTTAPSFVYYSSGSLTAPALSAGSGVSAANLLTIRSVEIHLTASDPNDSSVTGVPSETRITLENLIISGS